MVVLENGCSRKQLYWKVVVLKNWCNNGCMENGCMENGCITCIGKGLY